MAFRDGPLRARVRLNHEATLRIAVGVPPTLDPQLLALFQNRITYEAWTGTTSYGDAVYGPPITLPCRIEGRVRMIRTTEGQEAVSTATIFLPGAGAHLADGVTIMPEITPRDRITLPAPPFNSPMPRSPVILAVWHMPDETGREYFQELALP